MLKATNPVKNAVVAIIVAFVVMMSGCAKSDNPVTATGSGVTVSLLASFSKSAQGVPLLKGMGTDAADSIRIDSLVVVIAKIKFRVHVDSVAVDSTGDDEHGERDDDSTITFRGPFVLRIRDTLAIDFASQVLPAGAYDGVTFWIHRLKKGEKHEDSDERRHHGKHSNDSSVVGASIVVWGAALKGGVWTPFMLASDLELQIKIRGNFVVPEATGSVKFAFHFNLGLWFRDPFTGQFLDPSDPSSHRRDLIKRAIRFAFGQGHCGRDRNDDGHPDD